MVTVERGRDGEEEEDFRTLKKGNGKGYTGMEMGRI